MNRKLQFRMALTVAATAAVVGGTTTQAQAVTAARAHWTFDETGSPPSALVDVAGSNDGVPEGGITGNGSAYTFNGSTGRVLVPDSPTLNPGTANFSYTVTFTTTLPPSGGDYDLLRKGIAATAGGEYKVEVLNVKGVATAFCLVKDGAKHRGAIRAGTATLADRKPHTVTCSKSATGLTITVDGLSHTTTVPGGLGSISNDAPVAIGAKGGSGGDWFAGQMWDASIS